MLMMHRFCSRGRRLALGWQKLKRMHINKRLRMLFGAWLVKITTGVDFSSFLNCGSVITIWSSPEIVILSQIWCLCCFSAEKYVAYVSPIAGETEKGSKNENGFLWENNEAVGNEGLEEEEATWRKHFWVVSFLCNGEI